MTENQITVAFEKYENQIPKTNVETLRLNMRNADENCMDGLMSLPMKSKTVALLLAFFLGGVGAGRFYLGNIALGVARIVATVLTIALSAIPILGIIVWCASLIWLVVEWFLCYKNAKSINYNKINSYLTEHAKGVSLNENVEG